MRRMIRIQLTILVIVAIFSTTVFQSVVFYHAFKTQVQNDLLTTMNIFNDSGLFDNTSREKIEEFKEQAEHYHNTSRDKMYLIWKDANGTIVYDDSLKATSRIPRMISYTQTLDNGNTITLETEIRHVYRLLRRSTWFSVFSICIIIFLICSYIANLMTKNIMTPVNQMAEQLDSQVVPSMYKELQPIYYRIREQHENILSAAYNRQEFIANVSHELKNPLTTILGYSELMEQYENPREVECSYISEIRKSAERMRLLINDIIQMSELDALNFLYEQKLLHLSEVVECQLKPLGAIALAEGKKLEADIGDVVVRGNQHLLEELVDNLVFNAIAYSNAGAVISVRVAYEAEHAVLIVADTGIGIAKEHQLKIYDRFYRVNDNFDGKYSGSGLGLAIVKNICELHNARIELESEPGKGSTFKILF